MTQLPEGLPELPRPIALTPDPRARQVNPMAFASQLPAMGYTESQMRAYGLACYQAGLERAAVIAHDWPAPVEGRVPLEISAALRAEKQK